MRSRNRELMQAIKEYMDSYYKNNLHLPSAKEVASHFDIHRSTVYRYLETMHEYGMLQYSEGQIITDTIRKVRTDFVSMPIVGSIPCGSPQEEEEMIEDYFPLPKALFGDGTFYILRTKGDSMVDAGIEPGDLVVIRKQDTADPGQVVVALCDNQNTLKRLVYDEKLHKMVLHPENSEMNYDDIIPDELQIQGVAVKVMKSL